MEICQFKKNEKMRFDAIVGNPPYQESDGGARASAKPIYHHFLRSSKKISPRYLSLIIPARWYAGGKGLDSFRGEMLNDIQLRELHDCLSSKKIFPNTNISGGVCYFLWDSEYNNQKDLVRVMTHDGEEIKGDIKRSLKIEGIDIFIRDANAITILDKIFIGKNISTMSEYISSRKPFGFEGYFIKDKNFNSSKDSLINPIVCYGERRIIGYVEDSNIAIRREWIDKWKVFMSYANSIGIDSPDDNLNSFIGEPKTICTETYLVVGIDLKLNETSARNITKYFKTKFARYLHSLKKSSQHGTSKTFKFVPMQDFTENSDINWNKTIKEIDEQLCQKYNLSIEEKEHIQSKIKDMAN